MNMIVDTHIHVWDLEKAEYPWLEKNNSILNRTWNIRELESERKKAGITMGVLVQASGNFDDTDLMMEVAEGTEWISGVVAWLPLIDPIATQKALEEKYLNHKYFKGVRHQIHDETDTKWLLQETVLESLQILADHDMPYDLVGTVTEHIETALAVAEKVPALRMVFDHLNQPPIATNKRFGKWGELMQQAAAHKNFYAKISGLGTTSGKDKTWNENDIKPYVEFVFQHFGTDRCFCGGDWPVSELAGSYTKTWSVYKEVINDLVNDQERDKILYSNAKRFYDL
jgi:L-fuconolactonase